MEVNNSGEACIGPEHELDRLEGQGIEQLKAASQLATADPA